MCCPQEKLQFKAQESSEGTATAVLPRTPDGCQVADAMEGVPGQQTH